MMDEDSGLMDMDSDFQWKQNEQIFASFQENMALIAGNSFEILKLYEIIQRDYSKINERIEQMDEQSTQIDQRSKGLEERLEKLCRLI